jgi:hypothetical protein
MTRLGKRFDRAARRRREIEWHAIRVGAAETEDLWRWLVAWVWHNCQSKDQIGAVMECARRMSRKGLGYIKGFHFTPTDAEDVIEEARQTRRCWSSDNLARWLGVTYAHRQELGLTTIGAIDVNKHERKRRRKERDRMAQERRRRERGAESRAEWLAVNALSRTKPWETIGMSRAQWYRRRKRAASAVNETGPSTAVFLSTNDTPVSLERKEESKNLERRKPSILRSTSRRKTGHAAMTRALAPSGLRVPPAVDGPCPVVGIVQADSPALDAASAYAALPLELRLLALGLASAVVTTERDGDQAEQVAA